MPGKHCDVDAVKRYVDTAMDPTDIDLLIEDVDAEISKEIGPQDDKDKTVRKLAALMTARAIKNRDSHAEVVGPFRTEQNPLEALDREIARLKEYYSTRIDVI